MNETIKIDGKEYSVVSVAVKAEGEWRTMWFGLDGPSTDEEAQEIVDTLPPRSYWRRDSWGYKIDKFVCDIYDIHFCSERVEELIHMRPARDVFLFEWGNLKVNAYVKSVDWGGDYVCIGADAAVYA